eukprot:2224194-Pyramimonas_sp.AAC.1
MSQLSLLGEPLTNHIRRPWGPLVCCCRCPLSPRFPRLLPPGSPRPSSAPGFSLLGLYGPYCPRLLWVRSRSTRQCACPWGLAFRSVRARWALLDQ